ncbi:MAG: hypothetical protein LJE95_11375, partial [Acidobacteria bacterium]|nr:hypothetical protein [Acidobacteriota bacterium]
MKPARLTIWVDFNGDGRWGDGEVVARDRAVAAGITTLDFMVPVSFTSSGVPPIKAGWTTGEGAEQQHRKLVVASPLNASGSSGCAWSPLFAGPDFDGPVSAFTVYDDGTGPSLYVAGYFTAVGDVPASGLARWDGSSWHVIPADIVTGQILAVAVFDDGTGPKLYAGGTFTAVEGVPANYIAVWDGTTWAPVGSGANNEVYELTVFDDGSGEALYAGGFFSRMGELTVGKIARWDGTAWSAVGATTGFTKVSAFLVFDGHLYAGGEASKGLVKYWDGSQWNQVGGWADLDNGRVAALGSFDSGNGPELYAGGQFTSPNHIARWTGSTWAEVGGGTDGNVNQLRVYDAGSGPMLYAGGSFGYAGGAVAANLAAWDGTYWRGVGGGVEGTVYALAEHDGKLVVGGGLTWAGSQRAGSIALWNGWLWTVALAGPVTGLSGTVYSLVPFDDGSGPALYAGGLFDVAGGARAPKIARWNGSSWSAVGAGFDGQVHGLTVYDDGSGPALYVIGLEYVVRPSSRPLTKKWNGSAWVDLGAGLAGNSNSAALVGTPYDDGTGEQLYVGGHFSEA